MSSVLKFAVLGLGSAGPKLTDRGVVMAHDSSATSLPVGSASLTVDGVAISNGQKILYTALSDTSLNDQIYLVSGLGSQTGAQFQAEQLSSGSMPGIGDCVYVSEGSSNGGKVMGFAAGAWQSISVSVGA